MIMTPINVLFSQLNVMTIFQRITYQTCIIVFKCLHNADPSYLSDLFTLSENQHYCFRSEGINLYVPKPIREIFRRSISYHGATS